MKLSITLSLALATACSAFALSPGRQTASSLARHQPAFVRPTLSNHHGDASAELAKREMALHASSSAVAASSSDDVMSTRGGSALGGIDIPLAIYFVLWYVGNYYYNITNKLALKATGGASGFPMTISALQLGIGSLYGIFLWLAPDARESPKVTLDDVSCFDVDVVLSALFDGVPIIHQLLVIVQYYNSSSKCYL